MDRKTLISVIIPVLDESVIIEKTVDRLREGNRGAFFEVIVVDGDLGGGTISRIGHKDVVAIVASRPGRGSQMNEGARVAKGDILLFLHADTFLPPGGLSAVGSAMMCRRYKAGAFDLGIDSTRSVFRLIEKIASLRSRITKIPFGDQAIFVGKDTFLAIGGYREMPIMEEVDLMRRIKKTGGKVFFIPQKVSTSPRRWEMEGVALCTLRNWILLLLYIAGVPPEKLCRFYP